MDAISFLESQHREVEQLFEQIESLGDGSGREKRMIFSEIANKLENHAKLEEKFFYPEGEEVDEETTFKSYEEHDLVRALIRKIRNTSSSDESFKAKVTILKEVVEHHVEEDEGEYFPECKRAFGEERLEELGQKLEMANEKLEAGTSRKRHTKKAA